MASWVGEELTKHIQDSWMVLVFGRHLVQERHSTPMERMSFLAPDTTWGRRVEKEAPKKTREWRIAVAFFLFGRLLGLEKQFLESHPLVPAESFPERPRLAVHRRSQKSLFVPSYYWALLVSLCLA